MGLICLPPITIKQLYLLKQKYVLLSLYLQLGLICPHFYQAYNYI